jgi:fermentation-respiration switch protein FrsA (DUF1100 family)
VVVLHGVRADRSTMLPRAEALVGAGYAVLLPDLQAHGESSGDQITFGHLESQDAIAAVSFLRGRLPGMRLGGIGVSLGGAAFLLAREPLSLDALVIEAVYPTIEEALGNRLALRVGPLSRMLGPLLLLQIGPRLGIAADALRPLEAIRRLSCPVLVLSGTADLHTTEAETRRLFAAAPEPRELWLLDGARHEDLFRYDPEGYRARVIPFLDRYLAP